MSAASDRVLEALLDSWERNNASGSPERKAQGAVVDYHMRLDAFLSWTDAVEAAGAELWNPASVVRWNADKKYLQDLERSGVPVVPTAWISRGSETDLGE